jgi:hypothetical protein
VDRRDEDEETPPACLPEPVVWFGCLIGAVMPTVVIASIAQAVDRTAWPAFVPLLYIGVFTVAVLLVRPWTFR